MKLSNGETFLEKFVKKGARNWIFGFFTDPLMHQRFARTPLCPSQHPNLPTISVTIEDMVKFFESGSGKTFTSVCNHAYVEDLFPTGKPHEYEAYFGS